METKNVEEELDRLQDIFDTSQNTYSNEMSVLEVVLNKEAERRATLQNQLNEITAQYEKLTVDHEALMNSSKEKSDAAKKLLNELMAQNKNLNKHIKKDEELINILTAMLRKKQAEYEQHDANLEAENQNLEALYHAKLKRIEEMEEELKVNLPLSEKMAIECAEVNTGYKNQQDLYAELQDEERMLNKSVERSLKEISKLKRQKFQAKNELKKNREIAFHILKQFTYTLKYVERDNYEMDRQLYILDAENARLRAGIAYLKEDISTIDKEIKIYQSERQNIHKDRRHLYHLFIKKWIKDERLHKMFSKYQHDILKILGEYIKINKRRNDKLDYIHGALQLKYDKMESLLESKSNKET
ncbi:coiled-coil domain-containing protein 175-like [Sceloporus undulatus]|uniref:coiled-coil domain-containing protein 175-like n=1 Tax=Sceloporus undulatus TaxID=8520 RepID=UPI001C4C00D0|nr:coiled-coil domain-containing protein 175-like [Sceloporus undulatus]